ncbi:AraC family transcriptional regulator [Pacificispira spongiicola]|nr:AraC family transcriptional regulator [Pacificispira spongiicola]
MDSSLTTHVHPHLHVILKLDGADTAFHVRNRRCPVTDDTAVLVNAWEPHSWTYRRADGPTRFLTLYLEPEWLSRVGVGSAESGPGAFFGASVIRRSTEVRTAVSELYRLTLATARDGTGLPSVDAISDVLITLVGELRRCAAGAVRDARDGPAFDYRIRRAMGMLYHYDGPLQVDAVAREVGLSRPRFFELFKHCTGMTPTRVSSAARMERAIALLTDSAMPLGDLSESLHFATPGNFTRFFRAQIGLSPHAFRRSSIPIETGLAETRQDSIT